MSGNRFLRASLAVTVTMASPSVLVLVIAPVAGTTAAAEGGGAVGGDDIGEQTREALRRIATALDQVGAALEHVIRTRIYVASCGPAREVAAGGPSSPGSRRWADRSTSVARVGQRARSQVRLLHGGESAARQALGSWD
ncbi:MAG: Rid family hydrolase [Acidimicrobiales bacterium]